MAAPLLLILTAMCCGSGSTSRSRNVLMQVSARWESFAGPVKAAPVWSRSGWASWSRSVPVPCSPECAPLSRAPVGARRDRDPVATWYGPLTSVERCGTRRATGPRGPHGRDDNPCLGRTVDQVTITTTPPEVRYDQYFVDPRAARIVAGRPKPPKTSSESGLRARWVCSVCPDFCQYPAIFSRQRGFLISRFRLASRS